MAPSTAALGATAKHGEARKAAVAGDLREGGADMLGEARRRLKTLGAWKRGLAGPCGVGRGGKGISKV